LKPGTVSSTIPNTALQLICFVLELLFEELNREKNTLYFVINNISIEKYVE
jgi:hypothetical protein